MKTLLITAFMMFCGGTVARENFECDLSISRAALCKALREIRNRDGNFNNVEIIPKYNSQFFSEIKNLTFADCVMEYLPLNFGARFVDITQFSVDRTGLKEITKEDLRNFTKLEKLKVINNDLISIDDDLFEHNPKISHVNLSKNKIIMLSEKFYKRFGSNLVLSGNPVESKDFRDRYNKIFQNRFQGKQEEVPEGTLDHVTGHLYIIILCFALLVSCILFLGIWQKLRKKPSRSHKTEDQNTVSPYGVVQLNKTVDEGEYQLPPRNADHIYDELSA